MANRNGKHLLHVKSNQLIDGNPKLPTVDDIEYGEIAINYADGKEKISLKSSENNIKTISTDEQNELKFETKERVAEIDEVVSKTFDTMNKSCGFNENVQYVPQNELIQGTTSLAEAMEIVAEKANSSIDTSTLATKEELAQGLSTKQDKGDYALKSELPTVVQTTGTSETDVISQKKVTDELTRIDTGVSEALNKYLTACGFKDGEILYQSDVPRIAAAQSIMGALELIATEAVSTTDVNNLIKFSDYLYSKNEVTTLANLPTDKYLVIATLTSTSEALTLATTLDPMQEINIIVYNNSNGSITVALPSSSNYVNMSGDNFSLGASQYAEINIISDGTKNYIRFSN